MYCIYFILGLIATVCGQKEGEACTDQYTSAAGICRSVEDCVTARQDLQESGIQPTFCSRIPFGSPVVCCRDGLKIFDTLVTARATINKDVTRRVSERKCEEYSQLAVKRIEYSLLLLNGETFSISVNQCDDHTSALPWQEAELGEFPHMVAIGWKEPKNTFKCGGSLISEKFVLTAGQCSYSTNKDQPSFVRLGDHNLNENIKDGVTPVDIPVSRIYSHPDYYPPFPYNDIALYELATNVEFNSRIRPACLGSGLDLSRYKKVIATGWNTHNPDPEHIPVTVDPCTPSPCGPNSLCRVINEAPSCTCLAGYHGQAPYCRPKCSNNEECSVHLSCINNKCTNPCEGTCGANAECRVVSHSPVCLCPRGYTGDPFISCIEEKLHTETISTPCSPTPCGSNAICKERNNARSCSCIDGYTGNPYDGCRPECVVNTDCPSSRACINNKCRDPCPGSCGINADCQVVSHAPLCTCINGYTGDPFRYCVYQAPEKNRKLSKATINLLENNFCDRLMSEAKNILWMGFNDSQMCAGEIEQKWDSCLSEGGSPIQVALKENHCLFHVLGIKSFGWSCAMYQTPSVYTRVSYYLDWIEGIVWPGE